MHSSYVPALFLAPGINTILCYDCSGCPTNKQNPFLVPDDVIISPTYVPDLCHSALNLLIDEEKVSGISPMTASSVGQDLAKLLLNEAEIKKVN